MPGHYDWRVPVVCLVVYAALEFTWLWIMVPIFYLAQFSRVQPGTAMQLDARAAALCYAIILPVVYLFLIHPIAAAAVPVAVWPSIGRAAALGLLVGGVYNLTNRATLADYSWSLTLVDTLWGVTAFVAVTLVALCVARRR